MGFALLRFCGPFFAVPGSAEVLVWFWFWLELYHREEGRGEGEGQVTVSPPVSVP